MMEEILLKKDNNNSIRIITINVKEHAHIPGIYTINRYSGLHNGTMTEQPQIQITEGKVNRTAKEQAELEYNSMLSDYLDKGYKPLKKYGCTTLNELTVGKIKEILQTKQTDNKGALKHMLAKTAFDKYDSRWNKPWYASPKIDGVRCSIFWNAEKKCVETSSRGGKSFDRTVPHILHNGALINLFIKYPDLILDGELYIHGKPLAYISGLTRASVNTSTAQHSLQFYLFDMLDDSEFVWRKEKLEVLRDIIQNSASLNSIIKYVPHTLIHSYEEACNLHDQYVAEGYEGLVLRDPRKKYGYGSRDWCMIKMKKFEDAEWEIVGITPGLRDEDMVFVLQMQDGITFEAKPAATREERIEYALNADKYIGKMATIKYFGFGTNGRPNLPVLKYIIED